MDQTIRALCNRQYYHAMQPKGSIKNAIATQSPVILHQQQRKVAKSVAALVSPTDAFYPVLCLLWTGNNIL